MKHNAIKRAILTLDIPGELWNALLKQADTSAAYPGTSERVRVERLAVEVLECYIAERKPVAANGGAYHLPKAWSEENRPK